MFTPMVRAWSVNKFSPWFDGTIHHLLNKVHSFQKQFRWCPSLQNLRLISGECFLQLQMVDARVAYEEKLIQDFASRKGFKMYSYIHALSGKRHFRPIFIIRNHQLIM